MVDWSEVRVEHLCLPIRVERALLRAGVKNASALFSMTEGDLLKVPQIGPKKLDEIRSRIGAFGVRLRP